MGYIGPPSILSYSVLELADDKFTHCMLRAIHYYTGLFQWWCHNIAINQAFLLCSISWVWYTWKLICCANNLCSIDKVAICCAKYVLYMENSFD